MTDDDRGEAIGAKSTWKWWVQTEVQNRWFREQKLLDQFFMTLEAEYAKLQRCDINTDLMSICTEIKTLLGGQHTWRNAYHIEQLMVAVYDETKLELELKRKLLEASNLRLEQQQYYTEAVSNESKPEAKRILLGELINDLQWFYENRYVQRSYEGTARLRAILVFFVTFMLFFLPNWSSSFTQMLDSWGGHPGVFCLYDSLRWCVGSSV